MGKPLAMVRTAVQLKPIRMGMVFVASTSPETYGQVLREIVRRDASGHTIHEFYGQPSSWLRGFSGGMPGAVQLDEPKQRRLGAKAYPPDGAAGGIRGGSLRMQPRRSASSAPSRRLYSTCGLNFHFFSVNSSLGLGGNCSPARSATHPFINAWEQARIGGPQKSSLGQGQQYFGGLPDVRRHDVSARQQSSP